jgi:hypothetical protein
MKTIQVKIRIADDKRIETMTLEKHGADDEMETLAGAISTVFLKSKDALAIATKKGRVKVALGRKSKK